MSMTQLSFSEANALIESCPYSNLQKISTIRHIVLPPKFLGNISNGVKEKLNSELQLVTTWTDGVLVAYNNVKVLDPVGRIFEESPFVHFNIEADFIIFRPTVGCILKGIVNKKSPRHVGCLVHNCFNASVHKPKQEEEDWDGNKLQLGEEFFFKVTNIYVHNGVMSLRGNLWNESSPGKRSSKHWNVETQDVKSEGEGSVSDLADSGIGDIGLQKPSKKRKKSKTDLSDSLKADNALLNDSETDNKVLDKSYTFNESDLNLSNKKKKKKHKHRIKEENCEDQVDINETLETSRHKKHKKKLKTDYENNNDSFDISSVMNETGDSISIKTESYEDTSLVNGETNSESVSKKKNHKKKHKGYDATDIKTESLNDSLMDGTVKCENKKATKRKHSSVHETIEHTVPKKKNRKSV